MLWLAPLCGRKCCCSRWASVSVLMGAEVRSCPFHAPMRLWRLVVDTFSFIRPACPCACDGTGSGLLASLEPFQPPMGLSLLGLPGEAQQ